MGDELTDVFKNKMLDFMDDLYGVLGHRIEYSVFNALLKCTPSEPVRYNFDKYVARPYGQSILACDEEFMLNESYDVVTDMNIIAMVKSAWRTMSEQDKQSVWAHMRVLLTLNDHINQRTAA